MSVRVEPNSWPVSYSPALEASSSLVAYFNQPPSEQASWEEMACAYLWRWTGRTLGLSEVTLRPCRTDSRPSTFRGRGPYPGYGASTWIPVLVDGLWYNITCGDGCGGGCSCVTAGVRGLTTLKLPGPIDSIVSVIVDGATVPASGYRVDNAQLLVAQNGSYWPKCQDMSLPLGEVDTFGITYFWGTPVPPGGDIAAGLLATELWKAATGDPSCGLPKRIQTVNRQGVTIALIDSFSDVKQGGTGIWVIDSWVQSLTQPPMRSRVLSPDVKRPRITT